MKKATLYFLSFIAVQVLAGAVASLVGKLWLKQVNMASASSLVVITGVAALVTLALFLGLRWYRPGRSYVRSHPWVFLAWTALLAIGILIPLTWIEEQLPAAMRENLMAEEMRGMLSTPSGYFVVCMLAPLMEEVVFRGAMISALTGWFKKRISSTKLHFNCTCAEWAAIAVSAIIFGVAHFNPAQIPHALLVGILLGWLYVKTGSIVPCFLLHWINNSASYVLASMFPTLPLDAPLADYVGGSQMAVVRAVVCSLLIALPSLWQLSRIKRTNIETTSN